LVRQVLDDDADYFGPFSSRKRAEKSLAALHETFPVRQCSGRLPLAPSRSACVLAEMGRCLAPCDGSTDLDRYAEVVGELRENLLTRADEVVTAISRRMDALSAEERFEDASVHRDRLAAFVRAASRTQRLRALTRCPEVVAARREDNGLWAVHVVRFGRLAGAGVIPVDANAGDYVASLQLTAETVRRGLGPTPATTAEETEKVLRWLESPGLRLVEVDGEWSCPVRGATRHLAVHDAVELSRQSLAPFDERRSMPTVHRPAR
jgi:DNA polymerase-3 subunit epsilon